MFVAHTSDIPNNKYNITIQLSKQWIVVNRDNNFTLVSNICPHQKSLISLDNASGRVCPYHGWSYDLTGNPIGSGLTSCKNKTPLKTKKLYKWNSLLFTNNVVCEELAEIDLSSMMLVEKRIDIVNAAPTTIMDLFLDVDHIPLVHKGVYEQINLNNIRNVEWHLYDYGSLQKVFDSQGNLGAAWLAIYPGTMIEWQKGAMFITVINPASTTQTEVVVYKYKKSTSTNDEWLLNQKVWETAWKQQDSIIVMVRLKNT